MITIVVSCLIITSLHIRYLLPFTFGAHSGTILPFNGFELGGSDHRFYPAGHLMSPSMCYRVDVLNAVFPVCYFVASTPSSNVGIFDT